MVQRMKHHSEPKRGRVISVRMDDELYDWINKLAETNTRTMSHQVEHLLKIVREVLQKTHDVDNISVVREAIGCDYKINHATKRS